MTPIALRVIALAAAASSVACGKKGPPQPPLRPVPSAVAALAAERVDDRITLRFTVPDANADRSTPVRIDGVEIYAATRASTAPAPAIGELAVPANRVGTVTVRRAGEQTATPGATEKPNPGDAATFTETVPPGSPESTRYYAAAAITGNRRGAASPIVAVTLGSAPEPPSALTVDYTEQTLRVAWAAETPKHFIVYEIVKEAEPKRLTAEPVAAQEFTTPVEFGRERCFVVRPAIVTATATVIGPATPPQCATPVDRFAPAPPTGLLAVPGEGAVELAWTASTAADVAGYVVLRAEGTNDTLQRLTPAPIAETQYRDQTARPGVTYTYAVAAVDKATPPNESAPSGRQTVTARGQQ